jgi:hypothetical protein
MSLTLFAVKFIAGALILGFAWGYIREFFSQFLIPIIRKYVSDTLADGIGTLISWIDAPVSVVRKVARETLASFKSHVLGIKASYERKDVYTTKERVTTYIRTNTGAVKETVRECTISMDDLPPDVRAEMIKHAGQPVTGDIKADFEKEVKKKLDITV